MSATGGFWPGEPPAVEQVEQVNDEDEQDAGWPAPRLQAQQQDEPEAAEVDETAQESVVVAAQAEPEPEEAEPEPEPQPARHAPGELDIPDAVAVLEGSPSGAERTVGVVVSRFNGEISNKLLESALEALDAAGVPEER